MIAKRICSGRGIVGLTKYISHDAGSELLPQPTTSERVVWSGVYGMPVCDLETAAKVMRGRFADAEILKRRAGASARGRKVRDPFDHLVLSWQRGTEPTGAAIARRCDAAVRALISKLGLEEHHVLATAHVDKAHFDVHVATSRIHPETGLTTKRADTRKLQHLAAELDVAEGREPVPGVVRDLERGRTLAQSHRREQEASAAARNGRMTTAEAEAVAASEQQRRETIAADKRASHAARDQASPPPLRDTRAWRRGERQPRRPVWARRAWRDLRQRQRAELREAALDDMAEIEARHLEERCALSRRMTAAAVAELDEGGRRIAARVANVRRAKRAPTPPATSPLTLVAETRTAAAAPPRSLGQRVADLVLPSRPRAWEEHLRRLTSTTLENEGVDLVMAFHSVTGPGAPASRMRYRTLTTWATTASIAGDPAADVILLVLRDACKISDATERRVALLAPPVPSAGETEVQDAGPPPAVGAGVEAGGSAIGTVRGGLTRAARGTRALTARSPTIPAEAPAREPAGPRMPPLRPLRIPVPPASNEPEAADPEPPVPAAAPPEEWAKLEPVRPPADEPEPPRRRHQAEYSALEAARDRKIAEILGGLEPAPPPPPVPTAKALPPKAVPTAKALPPKAQALAPPPQPAAAAEPRHPRGRVGGDPDVPKPHPRPPSPPPAPTTPSRSRRGRE